jgi:hypothetical protein
MVVIPQSHTYHLRTAFALLFWRSWVSTRRLELVVSAAWGGGVLTISFIAPPSKKISSYVTLVKLNSD